MPRQRALFYHPRMVKGLADQIADLARKGTIPTPFGVEHFREYFPEFSETHLATVLTNYEKNGRGARRGRVARFERVSKGLYKLA